MCSATPVGEPGKRFERNWPDRTALRPDNVSWLVRPSRNAYRGVFYYGAMDSELRRYLDGLFVLLVVDIAATLTQTTVGELGGWLVPTAVFGILVYVLVVRPQSLLRIVGRADR